MASLFGLQVKNNQKFQNQERMFYTGIILLEGTEIAHWVQDPFAEEERDLFKMMPGYSEVKLRECVKERMDSESPFFGRDKLSDEIDLTLEDVLYAITIIKKKEQNIKKENATLLVRTKTGVFGDDLIYHDARSDEQIIADGKEAWGTRENAHPVILRLGGNFDIGTPIQLEDIQRRRP